MWSNKTPRKKKLRELCEAHGVKFSMGELFLSELKLLENPTHSRDVLAIKRAMMLKLIPKKEYENI